MKLHLRILNLSAWIVLLTILIIPGQLVTVGALRTNFGFPFRYVTQYPHTITEGHRWFLRGIRIDLLYFILDVLIVYGIIHGLLYIISKMKATKKK